MNVVDGVTTVGVPLIVPVELSKNKPVGRVGVIDQDVTGSPLAVGVEGVIGVPLVRVNGLEV